MGRISPSLTAMINSQYGSMFDGEMGYAKGQALKELLKKGTASLGDLMGLGFSREDAQRILGYRSEVADSFGDGDYEFKPGVRAPNRMPSREEREQAMAGFLPRSGEPVPTVQVNSAPAQAASAIPGNAPAFGQQSGTVQTGGPRAGMHRGDRRMVTPLEVLEGRGQVVPGFAPGMTNPGNPRRYY